MIETCSCGYFKYECECCGKGSICPVCELPKFETESEEDLQEEKEE